MHLIDHQAAWATRRANIDAFCRAVGMRAEAAIDDQIADLREQQERLIGRSQDLLEAADREGRELTADERRSIRRRTDQVERIAAQIEALELAGSEPQPRLTPANSGEPLGSGTVISTSQLPGVRQRGGALSDVAPALIDLAAPVVRPTYARLFGQPAPQRDDCTFARFLNAVAARDTQFLLSRPRAASTLTGVDGGFAVPVHSSAALFTAVVQQSQFLSRCRVVPLQGKSTAFPVLNFHDRSKGPAEFVVEKVAEGQAATKRTPKMRELTLTAHKRVLYWSCTAELMQDAAPGTDAALIQAAGGAIAMELDREIVAGTGVSMMLGINASGARIVSSKDGGQAASTVTFANLTNMISRLLGSSWANAAWYVNQTVLPKLFGVYHPVLDGANTVGGLPAPLTQAADGTYRLFGLPLVVSDFMPTLTSEGDIALYDLSRYVVGMREDLRIEVSRDFLFSSDEVAFRVVQRRDGMPIDAEATTPATGSTKLSPFVVLEAR